MSLGPQSPCQEFRNEASLACYIGMPEEVGHHCGTRLPADTRPTTFAVKSRVAYCNFNFMKFHYFWARLHVTDFWICKAKNTLDFSKIY